MLVDKEHVIEEINIDERELGGDVPGVHLRYNQTDPDVIEDGIDFVAVIKEPEEVYRIDFGDMITDGYGLQPMALNSSARIC